MSAVLLSEDRNIGSAYQIADGTHAWSLVIEIGGALMIRQGRHRMLRQASQALLAAAVEIGVPAPSII
jgi:hypothetical protein